MCVYVCMYIYIYTYTHIHTLTLGNMTKSMKNDDRIGKREKSWFT